MVLENEFGVSAAQETMCIGFLHWMGVLVSQNTGLINRQNRRSLHDVTQARDALLASIFLSGMSLNDAMYFQHNTSLQG